MCNVVFTFGAIPICISVQPLYYVILCYIKNARHKINENDRQSYRKVDSLVTPIFREVDIHSLEDSPHYLSISDEAALK